MNCCPVPSNKRITRRMMKFILKKNTKGFQSSEHQKNNCSICLSQTEQGGIAILPCNHSFCMECTIQWWEYNQTCPYCRKQFIKIRDSVGKSYDKQSAMQKFGGNLLKKQKTLRCQVCWADINDEQMRICYDCRSVYVHMRCLNEEEKKIRYHYYCEECSNLLDESQQEEIEEFKVAPSYRFLPKNYETRHSFVQMNTDQLMDEDFEE